MQASRYATIRYQTIDRCLQQKHRRWTSSALAEACASTLAEIDPRVEPPSRSTIGRDIRVMRSSPPLGYDAPIEWDSSRGTYYYSEPEYSIHHMPLSEKDLHVLDGALTILQQFQFSHQVEGLESTANRLQIALRSRRRQTQPIIAFSQPPDTPAYRWLDPLYSAIEQRRCLEIVYEPFEEPAFRAVISPHLLKEYNHRWFLIAYHHEQKQIRTYALDRIQHVDHYLLDQYYRSPRFHPQTYFNDIVGVSLMEDRPVEEIRLRTTLLRARYMLTKPIHPSLRVVEETPDHTIFSLRLIPNFELETILLSLAGEAQVLQPAWLAQRIRERLEKALQEYRKRNR